VQKRGLLMVYTGDGKGKTTASLGLLLRAVGHGEKVALVQFMKGQPTGEITTLEKYLGDNVVIRRFGRDEFVDPSDPAPEDMALAARGLAEARRFLESGQYGLVILDELNVALDFGLVGVDAVLEVLKQRPADADVVITGRNAPRQIVDLADLVSEVREVKHHYRQGIPAQPGIEY
jgi:cob(I)alamin adenosyltransferase